MVGLGRFELPTSPLSGVRSNQLSYRPFLACEWLLHCPLIFHSRRAGFSAKITDIRNMNFAAAPADNIADTKVGAEKAAACSASDTGLPGQQPGQRTCGRCRRG